MEMVNNLESIEEAISKLKPNERNRAIRTAIQDSYKDSLYLVSTELSGHKDVRLETHGNMIKALEDETKRKLICFPRGTFKSSIGVVDYSIWNIIRNPNIRILIDTEVYGNSTTYLREIKGILASERFSRIFGPTVTKTWNEGEIIVGQRTKNLKEATVTCGAVGTIKVGLHFDLCISDDLSSNKNTTNHEQRIKTISHYQYSQAILDPNGTMVVIGTRYHLNDILGWIIEHELDINNFVDKKQLSVLKKVDGIYYY
jgi:hypothetical protein